MNNKLMALFYVAVFLVLMGSMDYKDEQAENNLYCEMVASYIDSNGDYGWPDYKNIYERECE